MFTRVQPAAPDPILGLTEAYLADPNPDKINLAVGVFKDAEGKTPVLDSVKAAERRLVETQDTKSYLPIDGPPAYADAVQRLMFGADHPDVAGRLGRTSATPGGTGALRIAGDYLKHNHPGVTVWVSDPTWANHHGIFAAAGLPVGKYDYLDPETNRLDLIGMLDAVRRMRPGDVVVLHGCCHNPTGVDPSPEQWRTLAAAIAERGLLPLMDFAYQGFGDGLFEDAGGLHALADACDNFLVCSSFSKNFGLYRDRC
ncbi:MAG: aminotransferase class I/II-fold pyridoxal phosphate-dependent enzyme, partial [Planctomycetota bacterium]